MTNEQENERHAIVGDVHINGDIYDIVGDYLGRIDSDGDLRGKWSEDEIEQVCIVIQNNWHDFYEGMQGSCYLEKFMQKYGWWEKDED